MTTLPILEAVIFDVDGTLIDTERIQSDAFLHVLKKHGVHATQLTQHGTVHVPGETTHETWTRLKTLHELPLQAEELTSHKREAALEMLEGDIVPMNGVRDLIALLREKNVKVAVATSAQQERVDRIINGLGLSDDVDVIISANDVDNVKPAPDPYLAAAKRLGVDPKNCIVVEDAEVGVASAKAAGMKVVAVPNEFTHSMDFNAADLQLDSLEHLTYDMLRSLVNS